MLHEAVFYFGDKRSRDFFNRPLCLSVDSLALNFSAGSGEEKLEKLIWAAWLHQGGGGGTKCIRMGRLWGERSLVASVPCAWHHSSQKMWDLSTSGSPAGHARRYQRTGDIFPPVHGDAAISCFCEVGNYPAGLWYRMSLRPASRTNLGI